MKLLCNLLSTNDDTKKIWVLIDEYDTPFEYAFKHDYEETTASIYAGMLSDLMKNCDSVYKIVLNGV